MVPRRSAAPGEEQRDCREGKYINGDGFSYSRAVTVTSNHDEEMKFFAITKELFSKQLLHLRNSKLLCRTWLKNLLLKYYFETVAIPHLCLLQNQHTCPSSYLPTSTAAESDFRKRSCKTLWKLQGAKRDFKAACRLFQDTVLETQYWKKDLKS